MKKGKILALILAACLLPCFAVGAQAAERYEEIVSMGSCQAGSDLAGNYAGVTDGGLGYVELGGSGKFALLDLGEVKTLSKLVVHNRQDEYRDMEFYNHLKVEVSADNSDWTELPAASAAEKDDLHIVYPTPGTVRYIKATVHDVAWLVISEIEAWAEANLPEDGNVARHKPVKRVNSNAENYANLTDGNTTTYAEMWPHTNGYLQIDLLGCYKLEFLNLIGFNAEANLKNYKVEMSNDENFGSGNVVLLKEFGEGENAAKAGYNLIESPDKENGYRYIRISLINGQASTAIVELEAFACRERAVSEKNLAFGKTAVTTSDGGTGTTEKLTDGNLATFWEQYSWNPAHAQIDLGGWYDLGLVVIVPRLTSDQPSERANIAVWGSEEENFNQHDVLAEVSAEGLPYGENLVINLPQRTNYRYIRVVQSQQGQYTLLEEIMAYAKTDTPFEAAILSVNVEEGKVASVTIASDARMARKANLYVAVYEGSRLKGVEAITRAEEKLTWDKEGTAVPLSGKLAAEPGQTIKAFFWQTDNTDYLPNLRPILGSFEMTVE